MAIGFSSRVWRWNFRKQASGSVPTANGGGEYVIVRNVDRDRDRRGPRRGGDRPLGSAGNDGSKRDGVVAVSASRHSPAPPRGLSSPAGAGSASRSNPAPPRGALDARTRGTAPSGSRYAHHSTRNTGRERLNADRGSSYDKARTVKDAGQRQ